ncbi:hypothetical protein acdb102_36270 [Acidothermaceae bacterium B102]|nr:hypothetical protein acdb102_36270 [Acidothermaceae bacterium B102]
MEDQARQQLQSVARASGLVPLRTAATELLTSGVDLRAVILVEGWSDQAAVRATAQRRSRDLTAEGVAVLAMGGATNIGHFLSLFGPPGLGVTVAGLCDEPEVADFCRGLDRAGLGSVDSADDLARRGFFVCVRDLEDELIRALGYERVFDVIAGAREAIAYRTFSRQPARQGFSTDVQLRRFMGAGSGRKIRYGRLLVEALELDAIPGPFDQVLDAVRPS